jgi:hypothetical protein
VKHRGPYLFASRPKKELLRASGHQQADDATNMIQARRSVVWAEPAFGRRPETLGQRP